MHMLHFQLCMSVDPETLTTQHIKTQEFIYRGPTRVIKPMEVAVCLPCANNNAEHTKVDSTECELCTYQGWMTPNGLQSTAIYVLDNQSDKWLVLENGQSLFRFLAISMIHKAKYTPCRIDPADFFESYNACDDNEEDDDVMDVYEDDDDYDDEVDSGIYGDINRNMVYIALESIDQLSSI
jgi:hypothetical protein